MSLMVRSKKSAANEKIALVRPRRPVYIRAMDGLRAHEPDGVRRRPCSRPVAARLAAALLATFGLGTSGVLAQQGQEAPEEAPATQPPPSGGAETPPGLEMTERQFQDWILRCGRSEQGPEVCEMQQQQTDREGRTVMAVAVGTVPGRSEVGLLIILPLGIILPSGVTLQIDGGGDVPLEVERCERQGCRIERLVEPELLNRLKAGREAKVFFEAFDPEGQLRRLGVPISLLGFTAALTELTG
jgi:invasion protein IalB